MKVLSVFARNPKLNAVGYVGIGVLQILIGVHRRHSDDYWFGGLWVAIGLAWLFRQPQQITTLDLESASQNGESNHSRNRSR